MFTPPRTASSRHPRAFTMMEMIVFMAMTTIIMGITVSAVGGARSRAQLKEGVNMVVDALQTARSKAMANLTIGPCTVSRFEVTADSISTIPQQLHLIATFADPTAPGCGTGSSTIETFTLPATIQVRLDPAQSSVVEWPATLAYTTPGGDPLITLLSLSPSFDLIVSERNGALSQTVTVPTLTGIAEL